MNLNHFQSKNIKYFKKKPTVEESLTETKEFVTGFKESTD